MMTAITLLQKKPNYSLETQQQSEGWTVACGTVRGRKREWDRGYVNVVKGHKYQCVNTGRNTGRIISAWGFSFLFSEQPQWTSSRRETKSDGLVEHQKEPQSTRSLFKPSLPLLNPPLPLSVSPVFLALETHAPADPHFTHTHTHTSVGRIACVLTTWHRVHLQMERERRVCMKWWVCLCCSTTTGRPRLDAPLHSVPKIDLRCECDGDWFVLVRGWSQSCKTSTVIYGNCF